MSVTMPATGNSAALLDAADGVASSLREKLLPFLFLAVFFLPYVGGTRVRYCVLFLIFMTACSIVVLLWTGRILSGMAGPVLISLVVLVSSAAFMFSRPSQTFMESAVTFVNINFMSLSILASYPMRRWLGRHAHDLVRILFLMSIPINAYALFQILDRSHPFHDAIFSLYGGALCEGFGKSKVSSWAEGLVRVSGRATSIFNTMQTLAFFNVIITVLSLRFCLDRGPKERRIVSTSWAGIVLAFSLLGGFCSASKAYFATMAIAMAVILWQNRTNGRLIPLGLWFVGLVFAVMCFFADKPAIFQRALVSFTPELLGPRFGSGGTEGHLSYTIEYILTSPEALLLGVESYDTSGGSLVTSDCLYTVPILIGGVGFLLLYLGQALQLGLLSSYRGGHEKNPFRFILALFLCGGVGIQTLMLGRVAPLMLLLLLGYYYRNRMHSGEEQRDSASARSLVETDGVPG
jgi:hypothetical protein